ncbi:TolC family protein [Mariprofundus ferrooxydans]|uniref:TolC family protein n=1 Tax=Mariprofundus ferrooxydans TaxID=314344 RepID=UPI001F103525|nr:TolC family protein [Mariprofundus ferrooxydans]
MHIRLCFTWLSAMMLLASCATYHPVALSSSAGLASSLQQLQLGMERDKHPELPEKWRIKKIVPEDGLDENETIALAVLNSPQLKAARTQIAESRAALFAAGLLPDPQGGVSLDFPRSNDPTLKTGENFTLGIDLQQILTRGARRDAAIEQARATWLNVLWQEWQVIGQARMLWRRAIIQQQQLAILQQQLKQAKTTWQGQDDALNKANTTLDQEGLALTPLMDAQAAVIESERQLNTTLHDFNLLLGVDPSVHIALTDPGAALSSLVAAPLSGEALQHMLAMIGKRRPDLLALQAGYMSQEAKVREQILSQFPSFSIGANSLRDTAGLWTLGPFMNFNLPILNGNRGNVAVARATRGRLAEEYRFQLANARVQASKMAQDQQLAYQEWQALTIHLPHLARTVKRMAHALSIGQIDMLTFTTLRTAYFSQQARVLMLEQALLEQGVALDTLTGTTLSATPAQTNKGMHS